MKDMNQIWEDAKCGVRREQERRDRVRALEADLYPALLDMLAYLAADLKEGAPAMIASYLDGQDLETYSRQWHNAYEYGAAGVKRDYAMASQAVDQLNETQRGIAYDTGKAVYDQRMDRERQKFPQESKGAAITREGTVSLKGATVGGVTYAPVTQETMTRRQRDSVDVMRQLARVTGVDVVFYQSRANEKGEYTAANGFYRDGTVCGVGAGGGCGGVPGGRPAGR